MHETTISDLRSHLFEYLTRAEVGEEVLVTRRGRVIARIVPPLDTRTAAKDALAALRARARVGDVVRPVDAEWEAAG
jgi:prevent-host-death family protein